MQRAAERGAKERQHDVRAGELARQPVAAALGQEQREVAARRLEVDAVGGPGSGVCAARWFRGDRRFGRGHGQGWVGVRGHTRGALLGVRASAVRPVE